MWIGVSWKNNFRKASGSGDGGEVAIAVHKQDYYNHYAAVIITSV